MVINIGEVEKVGIIHALCVAIAKINCSLKKAFDCCHPDENNLDWYEWVENNIAVMKELKQLLDRIENTEEKKEGGAK